MRGSAVTAAMFIMAAFMPTIAAAADRSPYAPSKISHALYLQTTGVLAEMAVVEPCTTQGMEDAVRRADSAYENQDALTLSTQQNGYAVGFANCALHANSAADFATFAAATVQSGAMAIDGRAAMGGIQPSDKAHGQQLYLIAKWLLNAPAASTVVRSIARDEIKKFRKMHAI